VGIKRGGGVNQLMRYIHRSWTGFKVVELDIKIIANRHDKTKV